MLTPPERQSRLQSQEVECAEKQRLIKEYFDALMEQKAVMEKVEVIRAGGDPQFISVAEKEAEVAFEECYEAWKALNEHRCSQCDQAE